MDAVITLLTFVTVSFFDFAQAIQCGIRFCDDSEYCCAINQPHCCHHDDITCCNVSSVIALSWFWLILFVLLVISCGCCCCYRRRSYARQGYAVIHDESSDNFYGSMGSTEYPIQPQAVLTPPAYEDAIKFPANTPSEDPPPAYSYRAK